MEPINYMWTEKYRPKKIDEVVGDFKDKIKAYLKEPESMQHLLFYSTFFGTGKSTTAQVIAKELDADTLFLNSSEERGIETIRQKVNEFVRTKSSQVGKRRIVILDEVDGMTKEAQESLRTLMETYAGNALFILTCNNISKVHGAIQSRCIRIQFTNPNKEEIKNYLKVICEKEELEYTEEGLNKIIEINYPSIRNCVQVLQSIKTEGKTVTEQEAKSSDEIYQALWHTITEEKDWKTVKDYIFTNPINLKQLNKYFWVKSVEQSYIKMMQITNSNEEKFSRGGEELIIFVTSLTEMVK